eukprot:9585189-Lingulodinium_polyedra.AAC.1
MPSQFRFDSDPVNQRHQGFNKHAGSASRAWRLYGSRVAALLVLDWAWKRAVELGFEEASPFAAELSE